MNSIQSSKKLGHHSLKLRHGNIIMNHCACIIVVCDTAGRRVIENVLSRVTCSVGVSCNKLVLCTEKQLVIFTSLWKSVSVNARICSIMSLLDFRQFHNCFVKLFIKFIVQYQRIPMRICCEECVWTLIHFGIHGNPHINTR